MARKVVSGKQVATKAAVDGGPLTRAVHDVTAAAEVLTVGAVRLARNTLAAAVDTIEEVGGRVGSLAVTTVRGTTKAFSDIGGDFGELAKDTVEATGRTLRDVVAGTVTGARTVFAQTGAGGTIPRRPPMPARKRARRPLARAERSRRSGSPQRTAQTA